ncbi:MAG: DUF2333 family protein, partial [Gammaproteobacteria bacterium]
MNSIRNYLVSISNHPKARVRARRAGLALVVTVIVVITLLMLIFDHRPEPFDVRVAATEHAAQANHELATGYLTVATTRQLITTLLDKRGGYLSNDVTPPAILMDNAPNWEWGVLVQIRDMVVTLRNDLSRSQTQSTEHAALITADNRIRIDHEAWMFPSAEDEYRQAANALDEFLADLGNASENNAQFFARADNLRLWLAVIEKRLGDLSQRLGASVGQVRINTDLAGEPAAEQATTAPEVIVDRTGFFEIDDNFYEARGATWALLHLLRAAEQDFRSVLQKKNALVSLRQVIRELEGTQDTVWSPVILNGTGFGFVANHSLV